MSYQGNKPATSFESPKKDRFTGISGTTCSLTYAVSSVSDIIVWVNSVKQDFTNYSVSGSTLTLGGTLVSADIVEVTYVGRTYGSIIPSDASVGINQLSATGTKSSSTFLRGDNTFASAGITGITSSADATAITIDSGERVGINSSNMSSLDADANQLVVGSGSGDNGLTVYSDGSSSGSIFFANGTAGTQPKQGQIVYEQNNSTMLLKTANATAMSIDGSGRILTPLNVMFSAYASSGQTVSNYSDNDVVFGGEDFDVGSNFSSNTFTAPVTGKYWFSFKSEVVNASGWIKVKLIPTGKQYQWRADGSSSGSVAVSFSQIVSMSANDTAKVTIVADDNNYVLAGDSGSTYHQTTFSGYLLG